MDRVACIENTELVEFMMNKLKELENMPKGISEKNASTISKACFNVSTSKSHIKTLKDFSNVKGVGKWILKLMKDFFVDAAENEEIIQKGEKNKGSKPYMPQKNSVAYALLITLYRGTTDGTEFMRKQELIDAAEASGLSRSPIMPEIGKGKAGQFGVSSGRDWYSGWSCMKKLIDKGLVVKSSCPAKYMLTEQGKEAARECLSRSGLVDSTENLVITNKTSDLNQNNTTDSVCANANPIKNMPPQHVSSKRQKRSIDIPHDTLDKLVGMGYSKERVICAYTEVAEKSPNEETSSLWLSVLCHLREAEVYNLPLTSQNVEEVKHHASTSSHTHKNGQTVPFRRETEIPCSTLRACSSTVNDHNLLKRGRNDLEAKSNHLSMPPLTFGDRFEDIYEVVLILDDREKFTKASKSRKLLEHVQLHFKIPIEVRRLPVGDGIWIARHKTLGSEYVLDFIVERKNVDDLRSSIRDNRYREQKVRILRSGLKRFIYLVEGDPNACESAESIKTACLTTEILEGFDVQRTSGMGDTLRKYGHLTQSITEYYKSIGNDPKHQDLPICPSFDQFIERCQELDKMTVGDVFATQLLQVPQVTEDVAIAVLDLYPTVLSLARAYSCLDGDTCAQEELLKKQSNNVINGVASRNIFQFIWGG
ncbi:putative ERCC4 domain, restriction endonuclease type II [Helianthus annuus]|uniref:Crossover junction endonuclease MUS81 n=1 Tax=Helianthus annuus TaxID=4232 RepID=A0A251UQ66_HELAN|nr:crossover junction endonuclease MUS81 isoform X1 [Helianthus annuus]XP_022038155.1 crossover junction endonuclease MUS81 isoform X1 [Helianthus annuus]KAF5805973.1 putative ERCC4 domain, restriction endonuclease type II [Helianthus annuus]KAJ0577106.1 putative ERCC4 domain, restriction endonuclease type II [Helianthus annuus]KAJ0584653.1 putative ERCC4 domain, restriction endonuclease type II, EME1/EME2 domain-containing protein [Helianthus annuus]KAJ0750320.1 putative ERCC4 domain, restric